MIKEAIEKVLSLAPPTITTFNSLEYSDKPLTLMVTPHAHTIEVSTLQGLVDLYAGNIDAIKAAAILVHVTSPTTVELVSTDTDLYARRRAWARATYPKACVQFPFGQFLVPEKFIIGAHIGFQRVKIENDDGAMAKDLDYVLKIAGAISAGKERTNVDDGISQTVQMKAGVTLKQEETLRPIVNLAPYRTFAEIDQVVSRFIFRAHGDEEGAELAIFEADGGRWRLNAVAAIVKWLSGKFGSSPIIS